MNRFLPKSLIEFTDNSVILTMFEENGNVLLKSTHDDLETAQKVQKEETRKYLKLIKEAMKTQKKNEEKIKKEDDDEVI